jgi:hypothetical protein
MFSSQNLPVEQLPFLYISGMNVSVASNTVMAIAPGQCRDSQDAIDMPVNAVQYINSAVVGLNGLDQGVLAASTNYAVYEIADSTNKHPNGGLLSLWSNSAPLLPFGYDSLRLIGLVSTDGATHLVAADVLNAKNYNGFFLQPSVSVLSGGNATSFTAIDLSTPIPTTTDPFVIAVLQVTFIPAAAGDIVQFRPTGSTATANLVTITGVAAGIAQTQNVIVPVGVGASKPEIDYKVTASGDSVSVNVMGYYVTLS